MTESEPWFWEKEDSCNVQYWGFGMNGESWMEDNALCFESTEPFSYDSRFSALVSFKKGLFLPSEKGDGSFQELKDQAFKGSDYDDGKYTFSDYVGMVLGAIVFILTPIMIVLTIILYVIKRIWMRTTGNRYKKEGT